jgi:hypothetical protein
MTMSKHNEYTRHSHRGGYESIECAKALDGLYLMIGEEERAIRQNPAAAGSAIVSKVFGALR